MKYYFRHQINSQIQHLSCALGATHSGFLSKFAGRFANDLGVSTDTQDAIAQLVCVSTRQVKRYFARIRETMQSDDTTPILLIFKIKNIKAAPGARNQYINGYVIMPSNEAYLRLKERQKPFASIDHFKMWVDKILRSCYEWPKFDSPVEKYISNMPGDLQDLVRSISDKKAITAYVDKFGIVHLQNFLNDCVREFAKKEPDCSMQAYTCLSLRQALVTEPRVSRRRKNRTLESRRRRKSTFVREDCILGLPVNPMNMNQGSSADYYIAKLKSGRIVDRRGIVVEGQESIKEKCGFKSKAQVGKAFRFLADTVQDDGKTPYAIKFTYKVTGKGGRRLSHNAYLLQPDPAMHLKVKSCAKNFESLFDFTSALSKAIL